MALACFFADYCDGHSSYVFGYALSKYHHCTLTVLLPAGILAHLDTVMHYDVNWKLVFDLF